MKYSSKTLAGYLLLFICLFLFAQSCSLNNQGSLSVEVGLVNNGGVANPVARTDFFLLDDSLETILSNAKIPLYSLMTQEMKNMKPSQTQNYWFMEKIKARRSEIGYEGDTEREILDAADFKQVDDVILPHIIGKATTDFNGKTQFQNIKAGKYYLMGVGKVRTQVILWNLPVEIKSGNQTIILDNKNIAYGL